MCAPSVDLISGLSFGEPNLLRSWMSTAAVFELADQRGSFRLSATITTGRIVSIG
jgi:hypothetical protein